MNEDEILAFVGAAVRSVWAFELLMLMRKERGRGWHPDELVRELRASAMIADNALADLQAVGLVMADESGVFHYRPASPQLDIFVEEAQALYRTKPAAVIKTITAARNEKLRIFADSFRLKD